MTFIKASHVRIAAHGGSAAGGLFSRAIVDALAARRIVLIR